MKLNPKLKKFWTTKSQIKVLYGGRSSGKSHDTAGILLYLAMKYKIRVACIRRFQNKIEESVYSLLKQKIEEDEQLRPYFTINKTSIESSIGSEFVFLGIQRNLTEIKGLNNISITWIEEAEQLTKVQWDVIRPTILREEGSFCVIVFNPNLSTDFVYEQFIIKDQKNVLTKHINYDDNPFLSNSALDLIEADKEDLDDEDFNHIYKGVVKTDDNLAIIKQSWIEAAIDAHIVLELDISGKKQIGYDVADDGRDLNATVSRYGILCTDVEEWKAGEDELYKSSTKVYNQAKREKALIVYDSIGVGAGTGSNIKNLNETNQTKIQAVGFNAGGGVINPDDEYLKSERSNRDFFENIKAQMWLDISIRFRNTYNAVNKGKKFNPSELIAIDSNIPHLARLKKELGLPRKDESKAGKFITEPKDKLKKRGFDSPNLADAFIMAYFDTMSSNLLLAAMND